MNYRSWLPLWKRGLDTAVINAYRIQRISRQDHEMPQETHIKLCKELFQPLLKFNKQMPSNAPKIRFVGLLER